MLKKTALIIAATASTMAVMPAAAQAQYYGGDRYGYDRSYSDNYRTDRYGRTYTYDRYGNRTYVDNRAYNRNNVYGGNVYANNNGYYGRSTRAYDNDRRCGSGTTGTVIGGVAGALLGRTITRGGGSYYSRGGSGTTGAIIGGAVGALAGRAIAKGNC